MQITRVASLPTWRWVTAVCLALGPVVQSPHRCGSRRHSLPPHRSDSPSLALDLDIDAARAPQGLGRPTPRAFADTTSPGSSIADSWTIRFTLRLATSPRQAYGVKRLVSIC